VRLHQLRTVLWGANAAAICVVAWAGAGFLDAHESRAQPVRAQWPGDAPTAWRVAEGVAWDMDRVRDLLDTPLDGFVPPPVGPARPPEDPTPSELFLAATSVAGGFIHDNPWRSQVRVTHGHSASTLRPGASVGGWQLVRVGIEPESGALVASFRNLQSAERERVDLREPVSETPALEWTDLVAEDPVTWSEDGPIARLPQRHHIEEQILYDDAAGIWRMPDEEARWWLRWGDVDVFAPLDFEQHPESGGLRILGAVGARSAVASDRGLHRGDVVLAVCDTPVTSASGLAAAVLRGVRDGRVEFRLRGAAGAERTLVWQRIRRP